MFLLSLFVNRFEHAVHKSVCELVWVFSGLFIPMYVIQTQATAQFKFDVYVTLASSSDTAIPSPPPPPPPPL